MTALIIPRPHARLDRRLERLERREIRFRISRDRRRAFRQEV